MSEVYCHCDMPVNPFPTCQCDIELDRLRREIASLRSSELSQAKEAVIEAAKQYTKPREYQNVGSFREHQDKLADALEAAVDRLAALAAPQEGGRP